MLQGADSMWGIIAESLSASPYKKGDVSLGAVYRRCTYRDVVETARVVNIERDGVGITHVFYDATISSRCGTGAEFTDRRALSLATFRKEFSQA